MNTARFKDRQTECWTYPRICAYEDALVDHDGYVSFLDEAPSDGNLPLRIYIHIPYCKQFCVFCPYHKGIYGTRGKAEQDALFHAFAKELAMYASKPQIANRKLETIYFGGGDPGVISIEQQKIIWDALRANYDIGPSCDISMEGTALSFLNEEKLHFFKEQGVTRVSFGIQTFNEKIRPELNLEPTLADIQNAVANIRKVGFADLSVDMMYNLPGQTDEMLLEDLEEVRKIDAKYIDFYALNLYPNTTYMKQVGQQKFGSKPTNETELRMFGRIVNVMRGWDYHQVSSVSVSKRAAVSHLGFDQFLRGHPMLGIGPSSRSYVAGRNYRNHTSNERYLADMEAGRFPIEAGAPLLAAEEENRPFVFFPVRLRMAWSEVERSERNHRIVEGLIADGLVARVRWQGVDHIELTEEGRYWVGNIQRVFFSDDERAKEKRSFFGSLKTKRNPYNQDLMGVSRLNRATRTEATSQ